VKRKAAILAVVLGLWLHPAAQADQPAVQFVDPTIHLAVGANAGTGELRLRSETPPDNGGNVSEPPSITDFELPKTLAASVIFGKPVEITAQGEKNRTWRVDVRVDGLTPANTVQRRYATLSWAGKSWIAEYFLSNQPPSDIKFDTSGIPSDWNISDSSCISFRVLGSSAGLTGVGFTTNLVEENTKTIFPSEDLHLWDELGYRSRSIQQPTAQVTPSQSQIDQAANSGRPLYLCVDKNYNQYGHFTGTLAIFAAQKPEGKAQNLSIYSSRWKWVGYLLILLGSFAAYIVKVYLPATITRSRELEPALFLQQQLVDIASVVSGLSAQTKAALQVTPDKINSLEKKLSLSNLDANHFLHRVPPMPFNENVDTTAYVTHLKSAGAEIAALSVIVRDGLSPANERERTTPKKDQKLVDQACRDIDEAVAMVPLPSIEQLEKQMRDRIKKLDEDIANANGGQYAGISLASPEKSSSISWERVELSIDQWSGTIWAVWTVLVAAVGIVFLVWSKLSFGSPQDFLYCLVWGFGITAAGQQITAASVATGLGVTLPKTS
jgi:hypothetical protein